MDSKWYADTKDNKKAKIQSSLTMTETHSTGITSHASDSVLDHSATDEFFAVRNLSDDLLLLFLRCVHYI